MAEKQDLKEAPAKDELQVAVSPDTSLRKVELDLDDAPFLKEQDPPPPAKRENAPLQVAEDAPPPNKKKKLLNHCSCGCAGCHTGSSSGHMVVCAAYAPAPPARPHQARGDCGSHTQNTHGQVRQRQGTGTLCHTPADSQGRALSHLQVFYGQPEPQSGHGN